MKQEITVDGVKYRREDAYNAVAENYLRALDRETRLLEKIKTLQARVDLDTKLIGEAAYALLNLEANNMELQRALNAAIVDRAIVVLAHR